MEIPKINIIDEMEASKRLNYTAPILLFLLALAIYHVFQFTLVYDDAFIALRVIRNWIRSGIPVYNIGNLEWIPTSFLWVALLALAHKITSVSLPMLSQIFGAVFALGSLILLAFLPKNQPRAMRVIAVFLCAASPVWASWAFSGLEVSLFTFLMTAGNLLILDYLRTRQIGVLIWAGMIFGLLVATRLDGLVVFGVFSMWLILLRTPAGAWWKWLAAFGVIPMLMVAYLWAYFGTAVPVSFYAKVHGLKNLSYGIEYVKSFIVTYRLQWYTPLLIIPIFLKTFDKFIFVPWTGIIAWLIWTTAVGGDFMPFHRFIAPVWPVLCFFLAYSIFNLMVAMELLWAQHKLIFRAAGILTVLITGMVFAAPSINGFDVYRYQTWGIEETNRGKIGDWFAKRFSANEWIAVKPAGRIPYYSEMKALDFYCLTDRRAVQTAEFVFSNWIGHQKINVDHILKKQPKVIVLDEHLYHQADLPKPDSGEGVIEQRWRQNPLSKKYNPVGVEIAPGAWLQYFERKE